MADEEYMVSGEEIGLGQWSFTEADFDDDQISARTGACDGIVGKLLAKTNTRPGPDEELIVQVILRRQPRQNTRLPREIRIQRER